MSCSASVEDTSVIKSIVVQQSLCPIIMLIIMLLFMLHIYVYHLSSFICLLHNIIEFSFIYYGYQTMNLIMIDDMTHGP